MEGEKRMYTPTTRHTDAFNQLRQNDSPEQIFEEFWKRVMLNFGTADLSKTQIKLLADMHLEMHQLRRMSQLFEASYKDSMENMEKMKAEIDARGVVIQEQSQRIFDLLAKNN